MNNKISYSKSLFLILSVVPLGGIGIDLYSASIPELAQYLSLTPSVIKMTLSIFLVGLFMGMLSSGILSDHYGRKPFQIINAIVFTVSSLFIIKSNSIFFILFFRLLQGLSAGGLQAVARSMITDLFKKEEITKIALYITTTWGLGPVIAPWIGGLLAHYYGWKACFFAFTAYGVVILYLNIFILKETLAVKVPLNLKKISRSSFEIIRDKNYFIPVVVMSLSYSILIVYGIVGPYFVEKYLKLSSVAYGNIGLIIGIGYLAGTSVYRLFIQRLTSDFLLKITSGSIVFFNIISLLASIIFPEFTFVWILDVLMTCFAIGFIYPINMAISIKAFSKCSGTASGLTVSMILLISSIMSVLLSMCEVKTNDEFILIYLIFSILILVAINARTSLWLKERPRK